MKKKGNKIAKTILRKMIKVAGLTLPDFKGYYKAMVIQTASYRQKDRHMDQWNGMQIPEVDSLVLDTGAKILQEEIMFFSINGTG